MNYKSQWQTSDLSQAMLGAITQFASKQCLRKRDDKVLFNGFWRNGSHQNVCAWLDKATWHDIKTGDSGGCKDFAKLAFNMSLPEFMRRFGQYSTRIDIGKIFDQASKRPPTTPKLCRPVNEIWQELCKRDLHRTDFAAQWLINERGFTSPRTCIGSGFANLSEDDIELFEPMHRGFLKGRLAVGAQLVAPIRSINSDEVKNLFFRTIDRVDKAEKSRLLTGAGAWSEPDGTPRAFGFPHLIKEFPNIVLCEGMADYFAAEFLLASNEKWLPIGASNADGLKKWALWLSKSKYPGQVSIVYQLDSDDDGEFTSNETGPSMAVKAMQVLKENNIRACFFNWEFYVDTTTTQPETIGDLADSIQQEARLKECSHDHLNFCFETALTYQGII